MGNPVQVGSKIRRCGLLCAILGAHLLLFSLISVNDNPRSVRRSEEAPGILFFVELPKPDDTQPSTNSSSRRPISTDDPSLKTSAARDNTITLPPEIEGTDALIDWDAEASRVAIDAARRMGEEKKLRSFDQHPPGMGPLPPKSSRHKLGDTLHLEGGVIIDWVNEGCYYSNQNAPIAAFGQALRLQIPICTGARGSSGISRQSFEDWKKEQANR
jgi:hypothetical protein